MSRERHVRQRSVVHENACVCGGSLAKARELWTPPSKQAAHERTDATHIETTSPLTPVLRRCSTRNGSLRHPTLLLQICLQSFSVSTFFPFQLWHSFQSDFNYISVQLWSMHMHTLIHTSCCSNSTLLPLQIRLLKIQSFSTLQRWWSQRIFEVVIQAGNRPHVQQLVQRLLFIHHQKYL